ncbi:hypothetical protein F5148DRAFT_398918 [Russula earlei]|uniref:Uncharacterized protein n=1 Tax=Russula earlei TaxID=71964 RepID=A0ACC0TZQ0_9AGAM|nr:hypothetical protein F5148DRAFT_398918 [Russula earlei]
MSPKKTVTICRWPSMRCFHHPLPFLRKPPQMNSILSMSAIQVLHPGLSLPSPPQPYRQSQDICILSPIRGVLNEALEPNGCRSEGTISSALSLPVQVPSVLQVDGPSPDVTGQDVPTTFYSRAASSALTALDDEHSTPPTSPRDRFAAPSPLSSPPSSPPPSIRRELRSPPPDNASAGRQHPALRPLTESDSNAGSAATLPEPPRSGTKRRRQDTDSNDKPRRKRKKPSSTSVPAHQSCTPASAAPPIPASTSTSTSRASSSTSTSTPDPTATSSTSSITDASANDANDDPTKDPEGDPDNNPACPHPALLGTLIEALALSRASSLPLSTLTRTTPALAGYPHTVIASTLAWAVRSRILGCVRSSGEALPPTYFYDPASDPDRERGELLKCLMPRAGKRRETMKYKQYYWAPVVVGRGRTSAWDVDWEE